MSDAVLNLLPVWGYALIVVFNTVGRCGIPLPSSALMIAFGALVVDSLAGLSIAIAVAYLSALAGDIVAYPLGRRGGSWVERRSAQNPKVAALMSSAKALFDRHGSLAVLISRWPLSTVGPYVNLFAGAVDLRFRSYLLWCVIGEFAWVALYLTLGMVFAANLEAVLAVTGQFSTALALAALTLGAAWVWRRQRRKAVARRQPEFRAQQSGRSPIYLNLPQILLKLP